MRLERWLACLAVAVAVLVTMAAERTGWDDQPVDSHHYAEAAHELIRGDGYVAFEGERPRYPVGMSVVLAPATLVGDFPGNVQSAALLITGLLVVVICATAWRLGGPVAAAAAAGICVLSPAFRDAGALVLADPASACLVVGGVLAVACGRNRLGAVLVGVAAWVRLAAVALAPLVRWRVLYALVPLALVQVWLFGSLTGYSSEQAGWSLRWLTDRPALHGWRNISDYPSWQLYPQLLMGRFGWLLPGLPVIAGIEMWRRRDEAATRLAAGVVAVTFATYVVYYYQAYRFMLPAAALITSFAAAGVARVTLGMRPFPREGTDELGVGRIRAHTAPQHLRSGGPADRAVGADQCR